MEDEEMNMRFSTGAVRDYSKNCGGSDLPLTIPEAREFQAWYRLAGHTSVSTWENADVWGSDFRDGTDLDPGGGSDAPDIYFFTGHGSCQQPPGANDPDFIVVCSTVGTPNFVNVGMSSRWGNGNGSARFMFIDASCPMDLISLSSNWFPTFVGLHVAVGHSGTATLDDTDYGDQMPHHESHSMSSSMQQCIDACTSCANSCTGTLHHCLHMGGAHAEAEHVTTPGCGADRQS